MNTFIVDPISRGLRIDVWLSQQLPDLSRSRVQALIRAGHAQVDGTPRKPSSLLLGGERVEVLLPDTPPPATLQPEAIPLDILFEDDHILLVNKPPDLVVHPAPGHETGTLVHALLNHYPALAAVGREGRPGIVHRLDRDTSGVIVVAKTDQALHSLSTQFKARGVRKAYLALVRGCPEPPTGVVETLIGRSGRDRKKMSARVESGRPARSEYEVIEAGKFASLVRVVIETGRTHQIRVHMTHIGHPVLGDKQYGRARTGPDQRPVPRQMLHASMLSFRHPVTGQELEFVAPIPDDMREWIQCLRHAGPG